MSNSVLNAATSDVGKTQGRRQMQDIKNYFTMQLRRSGQFMDKLYSKNFARTILIKILLSLNFSIPVLLSHIAFIFLWKEFSRRVSSLLVSSGLNFHTLLIMQTFFLS